jgi:hypothetical protein
VAVDAAGAVYIADYFSESVRKLSAGIVTTLISNVRDLTGVAVDTAGNVYIAGDGVKKVTPNGMVSTVVGSDILVNDQCGCRRSR